MWIVRRIIINWLKKEICVHWKSRDLIKTCNAFKLFLGSVAFRRNVKINPKLTESTCCLVEVSFVDAAMKTANFNQRSSSRYSLGVEPRRGYKYWYISHVWLIHVRITSLKNSQALVRFQSFKQQRFCAQRLTRNFALRILACFFYILPNKWFFPGVRIINSV